MKRTVIILIVVCVSFSCKKSENKKSLDSKVPEKAVLINPVNDEACYDITKKMEMYYLSGTGQ